MSPTDPHQIFRTGRSMGEDDQSDFRSAVAQRTLLRQPIVGQISENRHRTDTPKRVIEDRDDDDVKR